MSKNDCDGKKCDDTAIPCYFASQVVFSLKCDIAELKERLDSERDSGFYCGILCSLQVLHMYDAHAQAMEIVDMAGGIDDLEAHAKGSGTEVDIDTVRWIKTGEK